MGGHFGVEGLRRAKMRSENPSVNAKTFRLIDSRTANPVNNLMS
jgi:hypothetical protein